ncbi:MAG: Hsp20/alpha crystallin family protein [Candidatus Eremiobacteraeota bacterium]|nr:Hsp20/alpha crystallin family protein [Candidatus Eremiobacteraeota bacterium]
MMRDPNRRPTGSLVGDLLGFQPFRFQQPESVGLDIRRTDQGYTLEIPVPGFRPDQIEVSVEDRELTVQGNADRRRFTRAIVLPDEIDPERIEAHVEHGLLTLQLPLHARMQPRRIEVRLGQRAPGGQASGESAGGSGNRGQTSSGGGTARAADAPGTQTYSPPPGGQNPSS